MTRAGRNGRREVFDPLITGTQEIQRGGIRAKAEPEAAVSIGSSGIEWTLGPLADPMKHHAHTRSGNRVVSENRAFGADGLPSKVGRSKGQQQPYGYRATD
jgi:hypothetical protein